jgi:hypothetical protein
MRVLGDDDAGAMSMASIQFVIPAAISTLVVIANVGVAVRGHRPRRLGAPIGRRGRFCASTSHSGRRR